MTAGRELIPCPGCGARFPGRPGPTHPYIGASAGCWELFSLCNAGLSIPGDLLETARVPEDTSASWPLEVPHALDSVVGDAYAIQHPGDGSPRAVQSVAVHLLTLYGLIDRGMDLPSAMWLRRRAAREKGVYRRLEPPGSGSALTLRHLFPGGGVHTPCSRSAYVLSVYAIWMESHGETVEQWFDKYVAGG